jgi:hypothetical protein
VIADEILHFTLSAECNPAALLHMEYYLLLRSHLKSKYFRPKPLKLQKGMQAEHRHEKRALLEKETEQCISSPTSKTSCSGSICK